MWYFVLGGNSTLCSFRIRLNEGQAHTQQRPWHNCEVGQMLEHVALRGQRPSRPSPAQCPGPQLSDRMWELIERCWAQNWHDRPQATVVIEALEAIDVHYSA
jgi:hypothetical protein